MKVSEITVENIANYLRLTEISEEDNKNIELFLNIAKNYIENYTGIPQKSEDEEADASEEDGIPENGWYYEKGSTYCYENGVKVTGMLKEISDEDGNTYGPMSRFSTS